MLDHDVDLCPGDLAGLTGRAEVQAFFARLGYPVERGRETYADSEGMRENLASAVHHMELLARDDLELLDVYLLELSSVTVARIQELASHFKQRGGQKLAVLTSDYERLDFVLFDSQTREGSVRAASAIRVLPRRISFDRLHGSDDRSVLRAVRRFSWTEPDALAQWDKLRSAFSIGEWSEEFFDNRGLFADYYLKERLPGLPEWKDPDLASVRREVGMALLEARGRFSGKGEAALREGLLEPILTRFGFQIQDAKDARDSNIHCPDYDLLDPASGERLAVCLAYQWDRFLDGPDPKDTNTGSENPGATVLTLLDNEDTPWAIVTNGKQWRLYSRKTESRATNFYQVDAEEAAADTDADAFRHFWLMFRAQAFMPQTVALEGETRETSFLDQLLDGSRDYAKQVGDRLKKRVFKDIFPILAEGFIEDIRAREGAGADLEEDRLDLVFNATLLLLYRLLFLLYAESRDLLPVREVGGYFEKSLTALKREVATAAGTVEGARDEHLAAAYSDAPATVRQGDAPALYSRLAELFEIIANGRPAANVPPYNGGLFLTDGEHALDEYERTVSDFLLEHALSDLHLARALDRLARDPDDKTHGLVMIDFKSLGVRQLGSIYEGLLEFKVRIASELMAVCNRKGSEVILPRREAVKEKSVKIKRRGRGKNAPEETIPPGTVYLENSKHERKATGSYYTPDYIVRYIIEHTVGPVLEEKLEALRGDLDRACRDWLKREKDFRKHNMEVSPGLQESEQRLVERIFNLKVLDPAMGSGHFLVTAVDLIADRLIHFLNGFPGNPVERLLHQTRLQILKELPEGLSVDESRLTDVNLLKRHVLKRCVYGVDLNRMAVELAKVSLWLHCFTLGAPLSFLDHHLKWGNSLIGEVSTSEVSPHEAPTLAGTGRWDQFSRAVRDYLSVSELSDATAGQVLASRASFREAESILRPHREELNVLTARWFAGWKEKQVGQAQQRSTETGKRLFAEAQALSNEHRFFHWPLEFPEVWYGVRAGTERIVARLPEEDAGFDAVVGNPPYVRAERADKDERDWIQHSGEYRTACGRFDVYPVFMERGIRLARCGGIAGFIVPAAVLTINYGEGIRRLILSEYRLQSIADLRGVTVFPEVAVETCVPVVCKATPHSDSCYALYAVSAAGQLTQSTSRPPTQGELLAAPQHAIHLDVSRTDLAVKAAFDACAVHLGEVCYCITGVVAHDGATGASKDRLIHSQRVDETCRPYIEAKEWGGRYSTPRPTRWIQYLPDEMHRPKFPELFESPKMLVQAIAAGDAIPATLDSSGVYVNHSMNCCVKLEDVVHLGARLNVGVANLTPVTCYSLAAILAQVASGPLASYLRLFIGHQLGIFPETLRQLPVRVLDFSHPTAASSKSDLLLACTSCLGEGDYETPLSFASQAIAAHAALYGPGGNADLRSESHWSPIVASADKSFNGREDLVHDLLASLAQRMIDLNRDRHAEVDRFLGWLEHELRVDVEDLTRKTHIKGYWEGDFRRLREALTANRSKLALPVDGLFAGQLQAEYERSMATLRPLEEALQKTDHLIDQIVYKLYGLTEEEIEIVESGT